jgi:hypothetical protein
MNDFNQLLFMLMCDPAFLSEIGQHPNRHLDETASYTAIIALWGKSCRLQDHSGTLITAAH